MGYGNGVRSFLFFKKGMMGEAQEVFDEMVKRSLFILFTLIDFGG